MLIISPSTTSALAPHAAEKSWVMFVQAMGADQRPGPILIEGVKGSQIAERLLELEADNAFDVMLIGLLETTEPDAAADAIAEQYAPDAGLHHNWYKPVTKLLLFIQQAAQAALGDLLGRAQPGALEQTPVDINAMAKILGLSVSTVRRLMWAKQIPCVRAGRRLRFVPRDVVASLQRR